MNELMRGKLGRIRLPSLLQLAESEALTGWIGIGSVGGVVLSEGKIVQASFGKVLGRVALMELFLEDGCPFRVEIWDIAQGEGLGGMLPLVLEGCRLMDEWDRLSQACPVLIDTAAELPAPLEPGFLNGTLTVAILVERLAIPRTVLLNHLLQLAEKRLVTLGALRSSSPNPSPPMKVDYYNAMDSGRVFLSAGEILRAADQFQLALAARPGDRLAQLQLKRTQAMKGSAQ